MSRHRRKSNYNSQYGHDSWDAGIGNNYWNTSSGVDPETYIRFCGDKLLEANFSLNQLQTERAKLIRHNTWYTIKYVISILIFWGPFVVMGVQFYTGHWFWGIVTFLVYSFVFDLLRFLDKEFVDSDYKKDTTFYDNSIREWETIIRKLQREIEIANTVVRENNHNNESSNSYTNDKHSSHNTDNIMECYNILGGSPETSNEAIKKKYHELINGLHPDRVRGAGLHDNLVNFAEEQVKKINAAYDVIKKERGIR